MQAPTTLPALWRQRRRWAQGMAEVQRMHGNLMWTANTGLIPISFQVLATAAWIVLLLGSLLELALAGGAAHVQGEDMRSVLTILAITTSLFVAQSFTAATINSHLTPGAFRLAPLSVLYPLYYWIVVVPSFLGGFARGVVTSDAGRWSRTVRTAVAVEK